MNLMIIVNFEPTETNDVAFKCDNLIIIRFLDVKKS